MWCSLLDQVCHILKALLHVSHFNVLSSPLCGMGIGFAAWSTLIHFRCLYIAFASLEVELDFDVNSCDKHVTKVPNWNNGIVQCMRCAVVWFWCCFGYDIDDAAFLRRYRWCCLSSTISTMQTQTMLPFFDDINDSTNAAVLFWAALQSRDIAPA